MKIKNVVASSLLALASMGAIAENHKAAVSLSSDGDGWLTADLSFTHSVAGAFVDTFTFSNFTGEALINAFSSTQATNAFADINLTSVTLNGVSFNLTKTSVGGYANGKEKARLDDTLFNGPLTLVISGVAGGNLPVGTSIAASYSATVNAIPSAVPEPETLAMFLAGMVGVVFMSRRRAA
nr:FxDxF family PEP-CTERM protein [uncultured Roseateles sp.]